MNVRFTREYAAVSTADSICHGFIRIDQRSTRSCVQICPAVVWFFQHQSSGWPQGLVVIGFDDRSFSTTSSDASRGQYSFVQQLVSFSRQFGY